MIPEALAPPSSPQMIESIAPDHGIEAVCFDLDGVLVDAADWHKEAFNETLVYFGIDPLNKQEHEEIFNGLSTRRKLQILAEQGRYIGTPGFEDDFYKLKQFTTVEIIKEKCHPVQRVIDTVDKANELFDNCTAVVTNCSRETAELMLCQAELSGKFQFLICNEDVGGKIKPHPWPYLKAKDKLGLANTSKTVLAIDDTGKGIISAIDALMRTWWLKNFEDLNPDNLQKLLESFKIVI